MLFGFSSKSFLFPGVVPGLGPCLQLNFPSLCKNRYVQQNRYFLELNILVVQDHPVLVLPAV